MCEDPPANCNILENDPRRIIEDICRPLVLSLGTLQKIKKQFSKDLTMGLKTKTNSPAVIPCFLSRVQKLPTGCERGRCLVLELSGSRVRVVLITLNGQMRYKQIAKEYDLSTRLSMGPAVNFFDYVADCLRNFVKTLSLHLEKLHLVFISTFPTFAHECMGAEDRFNTTNENVVEMLRDAVERKRRINICTYLSVNDTTALLMACAWRNCKIGVIMDKGCYASYLEQLKHVINYKGAEISPTIPTIIINTEWSFFGDDGCLDFIRTPWDLEIDEISSKKHERTFEKLVGNLYLGSLVRLVLLECIRSGALLNGEISSKLEKDNSFQTSYVIDIECDHSRTRDILQILGYKNPTILDCNIVGYVCEIVSRRSAFLLAVTLACLVDRIGDPYVGIAIDGYSYRNNLNYRTYLKEKLRQLVRPECKFDLIASEEDTTYGAALAAVQTAKQNNIKGIRISTVPPLAATNLNEKTQKHPS